MASFFAAHREAPEIPAYLMYIAQAVVNSLGIPVTSMARPVAGALSADWKVILIGTLQTAVGQVGSPNQSLEPVMT